MFDKIIMVILSMLSATAAITTLFMHTWIETHGVPKKRYGLQKVEIEGCIAMPTSSAGGTASEIARYGAQMVGSLGCSALASESVDGMLTWEQYTVATCKEATATKCTAAKMLAVLDPTDYCRTLEIRCQNLQELKRIVEAVFYFMIAAVIFILLAGVTAFTSGGRNLSISLSVGSTFVLGGSVVFFAMYSDEFDEPGSYSTTTTEYGMCFYMAVASTVMAFVQSIAGYLVLRDGTRDEKKSLHKKHKTTVSKKEKHPKQGGSFNQDYGSADNVSHDNNKAEQIFRRICEALAQQGCPDMDSAFRAFDKNGDGHISFTEIGQGIQMLGVSLTQEELANVMSYIDQGKDGYVNYQEFIFQVQKCQAPAMV